MFRLAMFRLVSSDPMFRLLIRTDEAFDLPDLPVVFAPSTLPRVANSGS